jgi:hypothetical protein
MRMPASPAFMSGERTLRGLVRAEGFFFSYVVFEVRMGEGEGAEACSLQKGYQICGGNDLLRYSMGRELLSLTQQDPTANSQYILIMYTVSAQAPSSVPLEDHFAPLPLPLHPCRAHRRRLPASSLSPPPLDSSHPSVHHPCLIATRDEFLLQTNPPSPATFPTTLFLNTHPPPSPSRRAG